MKQYKIFRHPTGAQEAVKIGWSWPAAFFTGIWSLIKGLWLVSGVAWVLIIVFGVTVIPPELCTAANLIMFIVFGINGNTWRENNLLSKGYQPMDVAFGNNPDAALAVHLNKN